MTNKIIPIFIPHIGCPHDCSFCNQKRIAGEITDVTANDVSEIIRHYLNTMIANNSHREVAYFGGSFTGLSMEKQRELLSPALRAKNAGLIQDIRISTRPDYISEELLQNIRIHGVTIIELGVQSTDPNVLIKNQRGHSVEDVFRAVDLIKKFEFKLGLQMMVGLLEDTVTSVMKTTGDLIDLKPDFVRVYPAIVIKDTYLERLYYEGRYQPFSLQQAVDICVDILNSFNKANIPIIRMGLQSTDEIAFGKSIVAGPYHPAFRELVEAENYRRIIDQELEACQIPIGKTLSISCNERECSKVSGVKQSNKEFFKRKYCLFRINIKPLKEIEKGKVQLEIY